MLTATTMTPFCFNFCCMLTSERASSNVVFFLRQRVHLCAGQRLGDRRGSGKAKLIMSREPNGLYEKNCRSCYLLKRTADAAIRQEFKSPDCRTDS
jgi:hypothetical protein